MTTCGAKLSYPRPTQNTPRNFRVAGGTLYFERAGLRYKQNPDGKLWRWSETEKDWVRSNIDPNRLNSYQTD